MRRDRVLSALAVFIAATSVCSRSPKQAVLTADMPLHLEDHLDAAAIEGSELPSAGAPSVEWRFDQARPEWTATPLWNPPYGSPLLSRVDDALRVTLTDKSRVASGQLRGAISVSVPNWIRSEWAEVVIRARADTASAINLVGIGFNLREGRGGGGAPASLPFQSPGQQSPVVRDGTIHTYRLRVSAGAPTLQGPWRHLLLNFGSVREPGSIDLLSVNVVPMAAAFAAERAGLRSITVAEAYRRSLFTHAPGRIAYQVRVPEGGRFHTGLGVLRADAPVEFSVRVRRANGDATTIFHETYANPAEWADRTIDLSSFVGETITLGLETKASSTGAVAFWGSPTISSSRRSDKPNVIFYVIDGAGADYMSVYGYNRRTTPYLERLAAEGAVFEHAYSNSSWTKPSTATFMTSLHNSVLGNTSRSPVDPLPPEAITMAERFHHAGYQTAVLTSNGNAGTVSGLERGVDLLREFEFHEDATSSVDLHKAFWSWRESGPGHPYWVHFQTTDVHAVGSNRLEVSDSVPVPAFAGLFVSPADVATLRAWSARVLEGGGRITSTAFKPGGVNRVEFLTLYQGMYDQQMAHNDHQLGRLVDQLKASGEWQNTVLIVAADHSIYSALTDTATQVLDPIPSDSIRPLFRPSISRVPLLVVWPGHIAGGQRFKDAVSLIDVLPTVLDLAGLPKPDIMQGQSLAPLLRGESGWAARPVIFDEVETNRETGEKTSIIEVLDGRWGASMRIREASKANAAAAKQAWPVLLFDIWNDPLCVAPVNEHQPDLLDKYTKFLLDQWKAHQALAKEFKPGPKVALTPEQLERLRALGYIR